MWFLLKDQLMERFPHLALLPSNAASLEELISHAESVWEDLSIELANHLVDSMPRRVAAILLQLSLFYVWNSLEERCLPAATNEPGDLELRGAVVFKGYYRNKTATSASFTPDGRFRTGDKAMIDAQGNLSVIGRAEDLININRIKISNPELQTWPEQSLGALVARVIPFPSRSPRASTEQITIVCIPKSLPLSGLDAAAIHSKTVQARFTFASARPEVFTLVEESLLPKTTLGKISRDKMRSLYEEGVFAQHIAQQSQMLENHRPRN
ncbi:acetyl-CoA synthetase-like protein [Thozetella sp. PMI_491]|nr:acetyl-CoA synthetase-like protein [Thozetella sp. PMI_491]